MAQKKVFASFSLDSNQGLEIAIPAEYVREATPPANILLPFSSAIDFTERGTDLWGGILPVTNRKQRRIENEAVF